LPGTFSKTTHCRNKIYKTVTTVPNSFSELSVESHGLKLGQEDWNLA
jgi:hypothetical protein